MLRTIGLILVTVSLSVFAQVMLKAGVNASGKIAFTSSTLLTSFKILLVNPLVIIGFVTYALSALFWLFILTRVELSFAYPMMGLSFVLLALISMVFLGENVSFIRWLGVFVIVFGVFLVSRS